VSESYSECEKCGTTVRHDMFAHMYTPCKECGTLTDHNNDDHHTQSDAQEQRIDDVVSTLRETVTTLREILRDTYVRADRERDRTDRMFNSLEKLRLAYHEQTLTIMRLQREARPGPPLNPPIIDPPPRGGV